MACFTLITLVLQIAATKGYTFFSKFSKNKKQSGFYLLGLLIPAVCVGHAVGRIGCFLAGCCYGKPTDGIFGAQFPLLNHKVYPTQLFEAVFEMVLFTLLISTFKKTKKYYLPVYLIAYGVFRFFLVEAWYNDRKVPWGCSYENGWIGRVATWRKPAFSKGTAGNDQGIDA